MAPQGKPTPSGKKGRKTPLSKKGGKGMFPSGGRPSFAGNLLSTILVFLILMSLYSLVTNTSEESKEIALSQVANDVKAGLVTEIVVAGDTLKIKYADGNGERVDEES